MLQFIYVRILLLKNVTCEEYEAAEEGELSLAVGDTIIVESRDEDRVWGVGISNGAHGKFPLSHPKPTALKIKREGKQYKYVLIK